MPDDALDSFDVSLAYDQPRKGKGKKRKSLFRLPPIARRKPKGLIAVVNNTFANSVLPLINPTNHDWEEWLVALGVQSEADLTCVYCGEATVLFHDHLNATILDSNPSGFFAEPGNLVPACHSCNTGRGNTPWERWIRGKGTSRGDSDEIIEQRIQVMRRFLEHYTATRLECRKSGDEHLWMEYDQLRQQITLLLARAQEISEQLRAAVTAHHLKSQNTLPASLVGKLSPTIHRPLVQAQTIASGGRISSSGQPMKQREMIRSLVAKHGRNEDVVCREYALAEERGEVERRSNDHCLSAEEYGHALWRDGIKKEWF